MMAAFPQGRAESGSPALRAQDTPVGEYILDTIEQMVCRFAPDTRLTYVNAAYCKAFGLPRERLLGRPFLDFVPPSEHAAIMNHLRSVAAGNLPVAYGHSVTLGDGSEGWQEWTDTPLFDKASALVGFQSVGLDVTAQRNAAQDLQRRERWVRSLLAGMDDLVFVLSPGLVHEEYFQPASSRLFVPPEAFIGRRVDEIGFPEPTNSIILGALQRALDGEPSVRAEYSLSLGGEECWFELDVTRHQDDSGNLAHLICVARDITARRAAEHARAESVRDLERFFEVALDLLLIARMDGLVIKANPAWKEVLGYTPGDLEGRRLPDFVHPGDLASTREMIAQLATGQAINSFTNRCRAKDGSYRTLDWRSHPVGDRIFAAARDVTEQHARQQELRRSQEFLEQTNTVARVGGWEVDVVNGVIHWSDMTRTIHEVDPEYIPVLESCINFYLEGESRDEVRALVKECMAHGTTWDREVQLVTAKGRTIWVRAICHSEMHDGECRRLYGTIQDVDEQHRLREALAESEAKFRALFELAPYGVSLNDLWTGRFLDMNPAGCAMLGYTREELLDGFTPAMITPPEYHAMEAEQSRIVQRTGRYGPYEKENIRKDGTRFPVQLIGMVMRGTDGKCRVWSIVRDIAEEREAERLLVEARARAEAASAAKSRFLANMSHELRTPLNGVLGMVGLLLESGLTCEQRHYAQVAQASGEALTRLIDDVLDISRVEAGKLPLHEAPFELADIVEEVAESLALAAHKKGLDLVCAVEPAAARRLVGDAGRLRQMLLNLASNALKFTDAGEVVLRAQLVQEDGGQALVRLAVDDTGPGVDPGLAPLLFEPFTQGDPSTTRRHRGTGLGLAICRDLARLMQGEAGLEARVGGGSRFWVSARVRLPGEPTAPAAAPFAGARVLLVPASASERDAVLPHLRSWGIEASEAAPGQLLSIDPDGLDAVLVDMGVPGSDALALARQLASNPAWRRVPRVLLAPFHWPAVTLADAEALFQSIATKPVRLRILRKALGRVLHPESAQPDSPRAHARPAPGAPRQAMRPLRILVVDDNETNRLVACRLLAHLGCEVHEATSGEEALRAISASPPDAVVMDCHMPGMDGFEATRRLRAGEAGPSAATIPVIAMTASAMQEDRQQCLDAGMDHFVGKPVDSRVLAGVVARLVPREASREAPAAFDPTALVERVLGDEQSARLVLAAFLSEASSDIEALLATAGAQDARLAREHAHRIKGAAANVGAVELWAEASAACEAAKAADSAGLKEAAGRAAEAWKVLEPAARRWLKGAG